MILAPQQLINNFLKKYQLNSLNFKCKCTFMMENICVQNCGQPSLHCSNKKCNKSKKKHKSCRVITLKGLTEVLQRRLDYHSNFLQQIQRIQEDFIAIMRKERQETFTKILFKQFQDEQIFTIQEIFVRKNTNSAKRNLIEDVYKKLLIQKRYKLPNGQLQKYKIQLKRLQTQIRDLRKSLERQNKKTQFQKFSNIVSHQSQEWKFILNCLNCPKDLKLLFRASQHQFSAVQFHKVCDGIPNLLVLVKTEFGKIIGGFNSKGQKSKQKGLWITDFEKKCFIFSASLLQKMDLIQPEYAICNIPLWGPCFSNFDICLSDKCNVNKISYSRFPHSYNFIAEPYTQNEQTLKLFSGSSTNSFGVDQYEVFQVTT